MRRRRNRAIERIKLRLKRAQRDYLRWRHGFDSDDLQSALVALGVREGQVALTHSSYSTFEGFTGTSSVWCDERPGFRERRSELWARI